MQRKVQTLATLSAVRYQTRMANIVKLDSLISAKVKADLEQVKADIIAGKIKTKP